MSGMKPAFETKQVQGQFANLQIDSEDKRAAAMPGRVRHPEKGVEEDQMNDSVARTVSLESVANHANLHRRHSDGVHYTRRSSLCLPSPSTTKLPKIPVRRLSSDITGSGRHFVYRGDGLSRIHTARQIDRQQGFTGGDLNATPIPVKRKSFQQENASSSGSQHAQGHHLVARRRSAPWSSASRQRKSGINTCNEAPSWQIRKHKRSLNIEDDDSDNLEDSCSRRSSSSSGFSSQSSLL